MKKHRKFLELTSKPLFYSISGRSTAKYLFIGCAVSGVEMVRPLVRLFYGTGETIWKLQKEKAQSQKERLKVRTHRLVADCAIVVRKAVEKQQERRAQLTWWLFMDSQPEMGG